jgi:AbrB family looped-hinge helix DNA binding protein
MRITDKGQVTIPQEVRESGGFLPGTEVQFVKKRGEWILQKAAASSRAGKPTRGERIVKRLAGSATATGMTTDEIMALTRGE